MPRAPRSENTPRPTSVFTPARLAPAAPAKEPVGRASATNADPRSTTKNPTAPATTAKIVATIHAFTMKPDSMALRTSQGATGAGRPGHGELGEQIEDQHQRHHEEAHRPALPGGRPVVAVIGEQHAQPGGGEADHRGPEDRQARPAGQPQRGGGRPHQQGG